MDIIIVGLGSLFSLLVFWFIIFIPLSRWIIFKSGDNWFIWYILFLAVVLFLCFAVSIYLG
jgi:hypothetical protein